MGWTKGKARPNRAPARIAKTGLPVIGGWLQRIRRAVSARNANRIPGMTEDSFALFAATMTLIGHSDDPFTLALFDLFCEMLLARSSAPQPNMVRESGLLTKGRIYFFASNHAFLPTTHEGLVKVGAALRAAGGIESVEGATFKVDHFVEVALALPDPQGYVEVSKNFGLDHWKIGTVFHPNTLQRWTGAYSRVVDPAANQIAIASVRTVR